MQLAHLTISCLSCEILELFLQSTLVELSEAKSKGRRTDKELISELEIRNARIETMKREFRLLFYSLDGAQVFFKDRD